MGQHPPSTCSPVASRGRLDLTFPTLSCRLQVTWAAHLSHQPSPALSLASPRPLALPHPGPWSCLTPALGPASPRPLALSHPGPWPRLTTWCRGSAAAGGGRTCLHHLLLPEPLLSAGLLMAAIPSRGFTRPVSCIPFLLVFFLPATHSSATYRSFLHHCHFAHCVQPPLVFCLTHHHSLASEAPHHTSSTTCTSHTNSDAIVSW